MTDTTSDIDKIYVAIRNSLRNYIRRRVGEEIADDLLHDIFVKAQAAINTNHAPKNLPGWLYAAARTTIIDYYRANNMIRDQIDENMSEIPDDDDDTVIQELATCIKPLIEELPDKYRDTLIATDIENKTMQSVAHEHGLSVSAIKSRASRGRVMLKEKLLGCCHVEMQNGRLTDYHHHSLSKCGDLCG